jgi:hypothetical protein
MIVDMTSPFAVSFALSTCLGYPNGLLFFVDKKVAAPGSTSPRALRRIGAVNPAGQVTISVSRSI